jgi:glucose/arabinose dehydrogenase
VGGASSPFSTHIRQWTVTAQNPNIAQTTFTPVISFPRPQMNHVGGWIDFSPNTNEGLLYIASGDGGGSDDNDAGHTAGLGNAQDRLNLLGKILRIDVDEDDFPNTTPDGVASNYGIPGNNPFVGVLGDDRIWSYGLRNPFRNSFDRATGELWIGDVGQSTREEINRQVANSGGGQNYGWRLREGLVPTPTPDGAPVGGPKPAGAVDPVYDYPRTGDLGGITVIGGYVYRGPDPSLEGTYFFGDAGEFSAPSTVKIWTFDPDDPRDTVVNRNLELIKNTGSGTRLASFGEDAIGNLYTVYVQSGEVYRIVTDGGRPGNFNGDAAVDGLDLAIWREGFGTATGATLEDGDADGDGDVDGRDFLVWQRNVGGTPSAEASDAVPEPSVAAAAGAALVGLMWARRRRSPGRLD